MDSIWKKDLSHPRFEALQEGARTDVLVIGGGMAGILCTYFLHHAGVKCMLVEADRLCSGITGDTTAKITLQHGLIYDRLLRHLGEEGASVYLQAQQEALRTYARLCADVPCDYEEQDAYVYSLRDRIAIEREVAALQRLGCEAELSNVPELSFPVAGAVRVRGQAKFHPLKFAFGIAAGLPIYEQTKVLELLPGKAVTPRGVISYKRAVVATHFPFLNKHGAYFLKLYQHRSYVLALRGAQWPHGMYVDAQDKGLSFRTAGEMLLLGGGGHRTGKQGGNWRELEAFAAKHYPQAEICGRWATQDCMTLDGMPYIGQYAKGTEGLYVATGFNKWGMSSAMVAASLLCDLLCGRRTEQATIFDPSRGILRPQLAVNAWESLVGLLTPTAPRCPHLGCALKYNRAEHSWDCPCHGSRFGQDGTLIDNPATDDKRGLQ